MISKIHVTIKNREKTVFDQDVTGVSSYNDVGLFDILPMHENFISLIQNKIILHDGTSQKEFNIDQGVVRVKDNKVEIYIDV